MSKHLSVLAACWNALLGREIDWFPRFEDGKGKVEPIPVQEIARRASDKFAEYTDVGKSPFKFEPATQPATGDHNKERSELIKEIADRARESLDEVKALTEYQDQKAVRVLTIATLLTALCGLLITRFAENYEAPTLDLIARAPIYLLTLSVYFAFGTFVLCVAFGALIIFHATRTRFKYPRETSQRPRSYLFYQGIIQATPEGWVEHVLSPNGSQPIKGDDLSLAYAKDYITESYLVAAKLADKVRYLERAQDLLAIAMRALVLWIILLGLAMAFAPAKKEVAEASDAMPSNRDASAQLQASTTAAQLASTAASTAAVAAQVSSLAAEQASKQAQTSVSQGRSGSTLQEGAQ